MVPAGSRATSHFSEASAVWWQVRCYGRCCAVAGAVAVAVAGLTFLAGAGSTSHLFSQLIHTQVFKCDTFALILIISRVILVQRVIPGTEPADGPPKAKQPLAGNNPKCTGNNSLVGRRSHLFSHIPYQQVLHSLTSALTSHKFASKCKYPTPKRQ